MPRRIQVFPPQSTISVRNAKFVESDGAKIDIIVFSCNLQLISCSIPLIALLLLLLLLSLLLLLL